jgi:hypothetical protein
MPRELPNLSPSARKRNPHLFAPAVPIGSRAVLKENELHNDIIEYCKNQSPPWIYFHGSTDAATKRTAGEPDFEILASMGRVFLVECKAKGGKLRPAQRDIIHWAALLGHTIHLVTNMEEFRKVVECT